ncbi:MAG TPA: hypothetical protein VND65_05910 [Candidatus Binatia bacterium]|nr:hypothetical protein [Candidatus Binatia bacterium]
MSKVSAAQKLGIAARVASQQVKRSRRARALGSAVATTARAVGHALHELWLQVIGLVFLIMAVSGAGAAAHEYSKYRASHSGGGRFAAALGFTIMFGWFGASSFWRVHRKSKGKRQAEIGR